MRISSRRHVDIHIVVSLLWMHLDRWEEGVKNLDFVDIINGWPCWQCRGSAVIRTWQQIREI